MPLLTTAAALSRRRDSRRPLALSLTGSGHLLVYQLGVVQTLLLQQQHHHLNIQHVVGASGGALAAAIMTQIPHRLEEYAHAFIQKRGGGLSLLRDFLEADRRCGDTTTTSKTTTSSAAMLHGRSKQALLLFSWPSDDNCTTLPQRHVKVPGGFHPWDVLSSVPVTYPEEDGIILSNGAAYVDGGIATPAPPTPDSCRRVIVSPLAGTSSSSNNASAIIRISPDSGHNSTARTKWGQMQATYDFGIDLLSWGNLRALRAATGAVSSAELFEWYERGQEDARRSLLLALHLND
jgi:hypothetical protein